MKGLKMKQCGLILILIAISVHAHGANLLPIRPTPSEMALLPEYCKIKYTYEAHTPEFHLWLQRLGPTFYGIHHYCEGLNYINRYRYMVGDKHRDYYLSRAVPSINDVANSMPPDFPLASEVYLNRGIAYKLKGDTTTAIKDFNNSLNHDPKQLWAYVNLIELYKKVGKKDEALKFASTGLKNIPGSKALQRIYLDLGGQEPFPIPDHLKIESKTNGVATGVGSGTGSGIKKTQIDAAPETGEADAVNGGTSLPKIGTPTNPYCRFCPPE